MAVVQVQQQLQASNAQLAKNNLAQEEVLAELRNQIAIIRCSELCFFVSRLPMLGPSASAPQTLV